MVITAAQISRAETFWAMRCKQFQMRAMRWLTVLLVCGSRRWVCYALHQSTECTRMFFFFELCIRRD